MDGKYATETFLADAAGIARACEVLVQGGLVAIPTETVYGLAARADSDQAVARIFAAKGRPALNPLIVHIANASEAARFAAIPAQAQGFAHGCWPGPTTLVLPRRADAPLAAAVSAGLDTVALRVPRHRVAHEVLARCALPLAAPSANRSGFVSPTTAAHVLESLDGRIDLVLDAGPTDEGIESTILKLRADGRWEQLRPGPVDTDLWHPQFFVQRDAAAPQAIEAPGQLASHYSPGKPVRLNADTWLEGDFMIGFGAVAGDCTLSAAGDLAEAAARLYACLHLAAASDRPRVAVAPVPEMGMGRAINDRLRRAAA